MHHPWHLHGSLNIYRLSHVLFSYQIPYQPLILISVREPVESKAYDESDMKKAMLLSFYHILGTIKQELLSPSGTPEFNPVFSVFVLFDLWYSVQCLVHHFVLFFWPLYCQSFDLRLLITPLVSYLKTNSYYGLSFTNRTHSLFQITTKLETFSINIIYINSFVYWKRIYRGHTMYQPSKILQNWGQR